MIELIDLAFDYGREPVLCNIRKVIGGPFAESAPGSTNPGFAPAARITTISGESGCGKSTLLRLIAGLERPAEGEIRIDGIPVAGKDAWVEPHRRNTALVFQEPALWPHMSVMGNLLFSSPEPRQQAVRKALQLLDMAGILRLKDVRPFQLSGGEARRVSLLRAFMSGRRYLLMDEPMVNLDPDRKAVLLDFLLELLKQSGSCLVYVTHDAQEVQTLGGTHLILQGGVLI